MMIGFGNLGDYDPGDSLAGLMADFSLQDVHKQAADDLFLLRVFS